MAKGGVVTASRPVVRIPMGSVGSVAELMEDWSITVRGRRFDIRAGFTFDGASVPVFLQRICGNSMDTPRLYAALWHDAAYSRMFDGLTRAEADQGYRDLLCHFWRVEYVENGHGQKAGGIYSWLRNMAVDVMNCVSWCVAFVEYEALRLCGASHWEGENNDKNV